MIGGSLKMAQPLQPLLPPLMEKLTQLLRIHIWTWMLWLITTLNNTRIMPMWNLLSLLLQSVNWLCPRTKVVLQDQVFLDRHWWPQPVRVFHGKITKMELFYQVFWPLWVDSILQNKWPGTLSFSCSIVCLYCFLNCCSTSTWIHTMILHFVYSKWAIFKLLCSFNTFTSHWRRMIWITVVNYSCFTSL